MRRYQRPSGIQQGLDFGMQLQQLAAPFINRQLQVKDQELRRQQHLEDIDRARNNQLEDLQRQYQLKQAMGEIGGAKFTPITPARNGTPASIGALPVSPNDPQDLMVASPGVFISPSENQDFEIKKLMRQKQLNDLLNPPGPTKLGAGDVLVQRGENGQMQELYRAPGKDAVQKSLEFKDTGDSIIGLDPITGQETIRHKKTQGLEVKTTPQGLFEYDPKNPSAGRIIPGTAPVTTTQPKLSDADEKFIGTLSTKNANKISIANQLEETFNLLNNPAISEIDKVKEGQRMLKVLNSAEGQDAVGVEESRRLGSLLEYQFGNMQGLVDPTQKFVGRDIPAFTSQLGTAVKSIRNSVDANKREIDEIYSRNKSLAGGPEYGIGNRSGGGIQQSNQSNDALKWMLDNPTDPRVPAIRKKLGL
jgi:hypothetical protein